jgi:hypothetical protein
MTATSISDFAEPRAFAVPANVISLNDRRPVRDDASFARLLGSSTLTAGVIELDAYLDPGTVRSRMLQDLVTEGHKLLERREKLRELRESAMRAAEEPAAPIGLDTYAEAVAALRAISRVPRASDGKPVTQFDEARMNLWVLALSRVHELQPDSKTGGRDVDLAIRCRPKRAK